MIADKDTAMLHREAWKKSRSLAEQYREEIGLLKTRLVKQQEEFEAGIEKVNTEIQRMIREEIEKQWGLRPEDMDSAEELFTAHLKAAEKALESEHPTKEERKTIREYIWSMKYVVDQGVDIGKWIEEDCQAAAPREAPEDHFQKLKRSKLRKTQH